MGTVVTIDVVCPEQPVLDDAAVDAAIDRALGWFFHVESVCSRFDERSELRQLTSRIGTPVALSPLLFEALQFALAVSGASGGAFDPTVGRAMEARGFNREHRTGQAVTMTTALASQATYRDLHLDSRTMTATLASPLVLDLGAVAKGLAVDLAARELGPFRHFAVDAGGDLFLSGFNHEGAPWAVGIRDPRNPESLLDVVHVSDQAVCTSGDYERRTPDGRDHHILDPRTDESVNLVRSATVVAATTMVADALATAAFVMGPAEGLRLLVGQGVEGLLITSDLSRHATPGFRSHGIADTADGSR